MYIVYLCSAANIRFMWFNLWIVLSEFQFRLSLDSLALIIHLTGTYSLVSFSHLVLRTRDLHLMVWLCVC